MGDYTHENLQLVGLHEPDSSIETDANGVKSAVPLPGFYTIGAVVDGVFVPILRRKAAGLFADVERAKEAGYTPPTKTPDAPPPAADAYAALATRVAALEANAQPAGEPPAEPPAEPSEQPAEPAAPPAG